MEYPYYGRAYTLGLEPFSCPLESLASLDSRGAAPVLKPGAFVTADFEMGFADADRPVTRVDFGGGIQLASG
jgi:hypothetical protein